MENRRLGLSGIEVEPLCLGGNVFDWTVDENTAFTLLDAFVDAGFGFIDTADVYSVWVPGHQGGESEKVIGNWQAARGNRDKLVIATKVGMWPRMPGLKAVNIIAGCEGSLKRLKTDYIDLFQSHCDETDTPMDETLEAFGKLIKAGKVRAIGASNFEAERLAMAEKIARRVAFPAMTRCSLATIWWSAISSAPSSRYASNRKSASSPITAWPPVFSAANTAAPPIPKAKPAAAG
jgi:aryl-alcohol dehydrogenase-like predicted oxidoreductase